jgi:hypothetical protein
MADQTSTRARRVSDEDIEAARHQVDRAFALLGLVEGKTPRCPECGTAKKGKVALRQDKGYWKCFKCDAWGSPIKLLEAHGYTFLDAVSVLLGRPVSDEVAVRAPKKLVLPEASNGFRQTLDPEVYQALVAHGSFVAAARYYARWHVAPSAVRATGAVRIEDIAGMQAALAEQFGRKRLVAAGVIKPAEETDHGIDFWMVNDQYPVIEPHKLADGTIVGMQMRPSEAQLARVDAHKRGDGKYVPKFLSLRGAGPDGLVGCGLDLLSDCVDEPVYIVEGFKDLLAVVTMGGRAYAIPGAAAQIPPVALEILARNRPIVALDADDAGVAGAQRVAETLKASGVTQVAVKRDLPAGMDATDVLVARHAKAGCSCDSCSVMRQRLTPTPNPAN